VKILTIKYIATAKFAYVANRFGSNISAYSIGSNGALTPLPGSPFATGVGPVSVAVNATAKFAYVVNFSSKNVSVYSIASNGALTPVPGSPFRARVKPASVAITRLMPLQSPYETENTAR
jgi:6-phosphogluconolactonase